MVLILAQELQGLCEMFTQDLLVNYICEGENPKLVELIPMVLLREKQLSK